eukprot:6187595-Amphidinium_carterae.1
MKHGSGKFIEAHLSNATMQIDEQKPKRVGANVVDRMRTASGKFMEQELAASMQALSTSDTASKEEIDSTVVAMIDRMSAR